MKLIKWRWLGLALVFGLIPVGAAAFIATVVSPVAGVLTGLVLGVLWGIPMGWCLLFAFPDRPEEGK